MSLLGRLEDLSLPDIIQIVFLSRRTGVLEILDSRGRHTVLFHHGLVVNASTPKDPDLLHSLGESGLLEPDVIAELTDLQTKGGIPGDIILERELLDPVQLAAVIHKRITDIVAPLLETREGEFNFLLSEDLDRSDIGYDSDSLFREGGVTPQKILGGGDGEKVKPLRGLEESLRAGKALLRGSAAPPTDLPVLELGLEGAGRKPGMDAPPDASGESPEDAALFDQVVEGAIDEMSSESDENVVRFPSREESPFELDLDEPEIESLESLLDESFGETPFPEEEPEEETEGAPPGRRTPQTPARDDQPEEAPPPPAAPNRPEFRVSGEPAGIPDEDHNVVLLENDPLVRVAAKRAFSHKGIRMFQFGVVDDARRSIQDLLSQNRFFVSFLSVAEGGTENDPAVQLLRLVKKKNRHLPVVMIDREADLKRRHQLLESGADLYLTRPAAGHLQPGLLEQSLAMFADELVLFSEHALMDWEQLTGTLAEKGGPDIGRTFYEIAEKEKLNRSLATVRQLIDELSNPDDISQVSETILRLASEYLDRAVLFAATHRRFIGVGGTGSTGAGEGMKDRARRIRIETSAPSVLQDVQRSGRAHHGKIRKTEANVRLIESLGVIQPTEVVVLPIAQDDRVLGLLYGDNAENRAAIEPMNGLELFLAQAAFAFENAMIANARRRGFDWD